MEYFEFVDSASLGGAQDFLFREQDNLRLLCIDIFVKCSIKESSDNIHLMDKHISRTTKAKIAWIDV